VQIKIRKNTTGGDYLYTPKMGRVNLGDLYDMIKNNEAFEMKKDGLAKYAVNAIKQQEPESGDTHLLNRAIRSGGFTEYIRKLESDLRDELKRSWE
jgi:hypothetical protein